MARHLSSPVFVGRSDELHALLSTADVVASGEASFALIGGEAGVGKSRLVTEVVTRLRERGWLALEGGAVPLGDDGLPFGPIAEALRALVRDVDPERIARRPDRAVLSWLGWSPSSPAPRTRHGSRRVMRAGSRSASSKASDACSADSARRRRSSSSSRTSTGRIDRPVTSWHSWSATPATNACTSSRRSGPTSCTDVIP